MSHWKNVKDVVVVGLGITGLSVVKHLEKLNLNLSIKVIDTRDNPPGAEELPATVLLHKGGWNTEWLSKADLVVTNPGIALSTPEIRETVNRGTKVVGDIELFAWAVKAPVIAITGSNGKSTVTDLTGVLAKATGLNVGVGGNIGVPALELLSTPAELYVLELSSFQLETTSSLSLKVAAFLNLSEDHMDRYDGMDSYRKAKQRIFKHAEYVVVNQEDRATYPDELHENIVTFGANSNEFSLIKVDGKEYLSNKGKPILPTADLKLVGNHNMTNVLTVLALLDCAGVDYHKAFDQLKNYTGLTHRCQVVADNKGIRWVNDSKATNVASTLAALSGLTIEGKLHLLVGGVGKGADFSELKPALSKLNVALYCYGEDADAFMSLHDSATRWGNIDQIIDAISPHLMFGDIVMLSPACASFDQFNNFMARGDAFTTLAKKYA